MYLRKRNSNLSIEKAVYEPAIKDQQGTITKPAVRTTAYIGSIGVRTRYSAVPDKILGRLSDEEKDELRKALAHNEPDPYFWLDGLPHDMGMAALQLRENSRGVANQETKKLMDAKVKKISEAWEKFFKTAQDCGLKRKSKRSILPN
jgi:hypothetical protein